MPEGLGARPNLRPLDHVPIPVNPPLIQYTEEELLLGMSSASWAALNPSQLLGSGQQASVYRATLRDRPAAVKVFTGAGTLNMPGEQGFWFVSMCIHVVSQQDLNFCPLDGRSRFAWTGVFKCSDAKVITWFKL